MQQLKTLFDGPPRWTLAVAESLTCGRVQAAVGSISGASTFFLGGITAYTIDAKVKHLGVDRGAAEAYDAVSASIARQMAVGAIAMFGSDFAVGTTGYAEPNRERGFTHPIAYWAIVRREGPAGGVATLKEGLFEKAGLARVLTQEAVAKTVLDALVDVLHRLRGAG